MNGRFSMEIEAALQRMTTWRRTRTRGESVADIASATLAEIQRLRSGVEAICQQRATSPITRARLRYLIAGVDWRKAR